MGAGRRVSEVVLLSTLVLALILALPAAADVNFVQRTDVSTGPAPTAMALLDARHLVVANDDGLAVLAIDRGLHFERQTASMRFLESIVVDDLNRDGKADVAACDGHSPLVQVLFGRGDGELDKPLQIPTANRAVRLRRTPLLIDEAPALAVLSETDTLLVGTRPQSVQRSLAPGGAAAKDLIFLDLDEDGASDAVVADEKGNRLELFLQDAAGNFSHAGRIDGIDSPARLLAADANGDGRTDLIVAGPKGLSLLRRTAAEPAPGRTRPGYFETPPWSWNATQLAGLAAADLDGDGLLDLAFTDAGRDAVTFLLARRDGGYVRSASYGVGRGPSDVILVDVTGDGRLDALVLNHLGDDITVLPGAGDGTFRGTPALWSEARDFSAVVVADLDGDRHLDLAASSAGAGTVSVFLGDGRGNFRLAVAPRIGRELRTLTAAPLKPGERPSLAIADYGNDEIAILSGLVENGFAKVERIKVGAGPVALVAGDFQGKDRTDLAVANSLADSVTILANDGAGNFSTAATHPVERRPNYLMLGDTDRDGRPDLVVGNDRGEMVSILHGTTNGLSAPRSGSLGDVAQPLLADDFDADGRIDLVRINESADAIEVLSATAPGKFGEPLAFAVGRHPGAVAAGDFNEDGKPDLAVLHRQAGKITILLNTSEKSAPEETPARKPVRRAKGSRQG